MANEQPDMLAMLRAPLVYRTPEMDNVSVRLDIAYRGAAEGGLLMDVYAPPALGQGERRPAVLFIHGGPISPALPLVPTAWGVFRSYGALVAASGWIGVTFSHRFYGYDQIETAADDIAAAVAYVREHAGELRADADRICLWAFSGGGPFLAAALREPQAYLRCLVAYYALLDLRPLAGVEGVAGTVAAETLGRFSPVAAVEETGAGTTPLLVARAGHDNPALNALCDAFVRAALAANLPLDLLNHPAGHHGFDTIDDDARTREILDHTLAFLRAHLDQ
jgi:acetyl esterase/lipase